jgi:hypothetical protein
MSRGARRGWSCAAEQMQQRRPKKSARPGCLGHTKFYQKIPHKALVAPCFLRVPRINQNQKESKMPDGYRVGTGHRRGRSSKPIIEIGLTRAFTAETLGTLLELAAQSRSSIERASGPSASLVRIEEDLSF